MPGTSRGTRCFHIRIRVSRAGLKGFKDLAQKRVLIGQQRLSRTERQLVESIQHDPMRAVRIRDDFHDAMKKRSDHVNIPLASGESTYGIFEFKRSSSARPWNRAVRYLLLRRRAHDEEDRRHGAGAVAARYQFPRGRLPVLSINLVRTLLTYPEPFQ